MNFFIDLELEPGTPNNFDLSLKALGLACASHSAVTVSPSLPRNPVAGVSAGPAQCWEPSPSWLLCAVPGAMLLPHNRPLTPNCSGAALGSTGHGIYLLLSLLQVAKELLQEICEQMGAGEQEEIQEFVLFAIRSDKNLGK